MSDDPDFYRELYLAAQKELSAVGQKHTMPSHLVKLEQEVQELRVINEHLRNRTGELNDRIKHLIRLGLETSQYGATKYREMWEQEEEL